MPLHKTSMNLDLSHLPVSLQYHGFTYLGIQIRTTVAQIVKDNFNSALIKVKKDLNSWSVLDTGLHERVSVIKMNILHESISYSLLSLSLPVSFFLRILTLCVGLLFGKGNTPGSAFPLFCDAKLLVASPYQILNPIFARSKSKP